MADFVLGDDQIARRDSGSAMTEDIDAAALAYHTADPPGKIAITPTKPLMTQRDLALAYSPGVAAASRAIARDPSEASRLTARGNLVAVITNGTAVLGLGAIGPLAAKPVMEGKAVLFKKFAGLDSIDIEIAENDPDKLIAIIAALEPSFGAINLEDIKAPECFQVETELKHRMKIPVFHDDQHGTAIIVAAAITNWLRISGRRLADVRVVASGAGAAALSCLDLLVSMGLPVENVTVTDIVGVVYRGRNELMDPRKDRYAIETSARRLAEVMPGADIFLGLSAGGVLKPEMVAAMAPNPLVLALANPTPEILPEEVRKVRPDAVMATGRSDYPNQVNNVLCFPFIFRGALDVGATTINEPMKLACVHALAELAMAEGSDVVAAAYGEEPQRFGPEYLIPKPFDPRLILKLAPAVAQAAMESGVATRPIMDFDAYRERLAHFVFRSGLVMRPLFTRAKRDPKRIIYAEGEEEKVLRAAQTVVDENLGRPLLVGRAEVVKTRIARLGLRIQPGQDVDLVDPDFDRRYNEYWRDYHRIMERRGTSPAQARTVLRTSNTVIAAMLLRKGEGDAMICGVIGQYTRHFRHVMNVIGLRPGARAAAALSVMVLPAGPIFVCDTHVSFDPSPAEIAETTIMAAEQVRRFGLQPKIALVSHSDFGTHDDPPAEKMRQALVEIAALAPDLEVEGEMHADAALSEEIRRENFPNSRLKGAANLLIMPTMDAANIAINMLKVLGEAQPIGPILLGAARTTHILNPSITVRGIVNMSAVATVDAQADGVQAA
jgi:malate dehydrogenase (oxaloacetate-decarboxylating)(NADP+)